MTIITRDKIGNKRVWWFTTDTRMWFLLRRVARWADSHGFARVARWIWRHQSSACHLCGALVGFNSVVSRIGFTCWPCLRGAKSQEGKDV
jgi:hypothetical protein